MTRKTEFRHSIYGKFCLRISYKNACWPHKTLRSAGVPKFDINIEILVDMMPLITAAECGHRSSLLGSVHHLDWSSPIINSFQLKVES